MTEAITQMLVSGQNDLMWFESNLPKLTAKYDSQFIAFHNKEVIEADYSLDTLLKKLEKKGVHAYEVLIKFVSKVKFIL